MGAAWTDRKGTWSPLKMQKICTVRTSYPIQYMHVGKPSTRRQQTTIV